MIGLKMKFSLKNAQDWDEVVLRRVNPQMTRFKAMSWEEKATSLE
jgi:hypothetical protein